MCKRLILVFLIFMVLFSLVSCPGRSQYQVRVEEDSSKNEVIPFHYKDSYGLIDSSRNVIVAPDSYMMISDNCRQYVLQETSLGSGDLSILDATGKKLWTASAWTSDLVWISQKFLFMATYDDYNKKTYEMVEVSPFAIHSIPTVSRFIENMVCTKFTQDDVEFPIAFIDWNQNPCKAAYYTADMEREVSVPFPTIHLMPMVDGAAVVVTDDFNLKVIDSNGNVIAEDIWDCGWNFTEGLLPVKFRDRSGFINNRGDFVFECPISLDYYGYAQSPKGTPNLDCSFCEGLVYVPVSTTEWNVYDREGNCLAEGLGFVPRRGSAFRDGLLCVYDKDERHKYGYMDKYGKLKIPCIFIDANDFRGGYAMVVYNGKDALVDTEGNVFYSEDIVAGNKAPAFSVNDFNLP